MKRPVMALALAAGLLLSGCGLGDAAMNAVPVPKAPSETPTPTPSATGKNAPSTDEDPYGLMAAAEKLAGDYDLGAMTSSDLMTLLGQYAAKDDGTVNKDTLCADLATGKADMETLKQQALDAIENTSSDDPDGVQMDFSELTSLVDGLWSALGPALGDLDTLCG